MSSDLFQDEDISREERDIKLSTAFRKLLPLLAVYKWQLLSCLGLLAAGTGLSLVWPVLVKRGIDGPLTGQLGLPTSERDFTPLIWIGLAMLAAQILTLVFQIVQRIWLEKIGQNVMLELKERLFNHILGQDITFFDQHPVGRLMARVESDTESLRLLFTNTVVLVLGDLLLMTGIYVVMFYYHWKLALVLLIAVPVLLGLVYIFHRMTSHRFFEMRKRMAEVTATITEFLHGMSIVQIFHRGDYARKRVYDVNKAKFDLDAYTGVAVCIFFNLLFYLEYVKIGLILLLGAFWSVSAGTILMFIILIWREFDPIARTAEQLGSFQKGLAGARRIFSLLDVQPTVVDQAEPKAWTGLTGSIRFENVWFKYSEEDDWVLKDVSFEIPTGRRVALAGVTGGGKSTVISLLLRLYDPQKGRITVDGLDLREIRLADLRKRFALVLQDIILFPGDIAANIGLSAEGMTQEKVESAAKTVAADRFIDGLPQGYKTEVSEKGANFSRGERQLLSFARALAVDPDVLILDEATSSVDPDTERTIQASLKKLMQGRTSLIIAHRLSTILDVDEILVIRRGEIVERGTHTELLLQDGYYSRLFHLQFKAKNGAVTNA